ncbi:MAG: hypothetical protein JW761_08460 [Prolixibacteraceae bacterium]|nr:hypothetical protein [Prolixibacteraceae bacterium]
MYPFLIVISLVWFSEFYAPETHSTENDLLKAHIQITELPVHSDASLRGLYVVSEKVIWASGSGGTVLQSVDGGKVWKEIKIPGQTNNDFRSIHAWDENRVLVFGIAGPDFGFLTEDGGKSWQVVYQNTTGGLFFNSLKFASEKVGLAVSDPVNGKPFVIKTTDGGKTWKIIKNIPDAKEGEANFAASNTCIEFLPSGKAWMATGGSAARIFYSEDFGENWKVAETPMIYGGTSSGIFSVCFVNDREGAIVGGTYDNPELNEKMAAFTTDGGKTWLLSENMPNEYRSCVQRAGTSKDGFLFVIGKTGCDISADGGKNWNFVKETNYFTFRPVPGKNIGFAAGSEGRIARVEFQ